YITHFHNMDKPDSLVIITELMEGDTLHHYLEQHPVRSAAHPLPFLLPIMLQISRGIHVLTQMRIIHRDLKPQNIMVDTSGPVPVVKIIGLNLCYVLGEEDACHEPECGNRFYRAPERYVRDQDHPHGSEGPDGRPEYDTAADAFAIGLIFNQMVKADWVMHHVRSIQDLMQMHQRGNFDTLTNVDTGIEGLAEIINSMVQ
ncbi:hypothetical protein KIPB_012303, partial [Kipferlia bialata]